MLDNGRCCGRKPLEYRTPHHHFFCTRCDAQYDSMGRQVDNFHWVRFAGKLHHGWTVRDAAFAMLGGLKNLRAPIWGSIHWCTDPGQAAHAEREQWLGIVDDAIFTAEGGEFPRDPAEKEGE